MEKVLNEIKSLKKLKDFSEYYKLFNEVFPNQNIKWKDFIKKENRINHILDLSHQLGEIDYKQKFIIREVYNSELEKKENKKSDRKIKTIVNRFNYNYYVKYFDADITFKQFSKKKKEKEEKINELIYKRDTVNTQQLKNRYRFGSNLRPEYKKYTDTLGIEYKNITFNGTSVFDKSSAFASVKQHIDKNKVQVIKTLIRYKHTKNTVYRQGKKGPFIFKDDDDWKYIIINTYTDDINFILTASHIFNTDKLMESSPKFVEFLECKIIDLGV